VKKKRVLQSSIIEHYSKMSTQTNRKEFKTRIGRKIVQPKKNRLIRLWLRSNLNNKNVYIYIINYHILLS